MGRGRRGSGSLAAGGMQKVLDNYGLDSYDARTQLNKKQKDLLKKVDIDEFDLPKGVHVTQAFSDVHQEADGRIVMRENSGEQHEVLADHRQAKQALLGMLAPVGDLKPDLNGMSYHDSYMGKSGAEIYVSFSDGSNFTSRGGDSRYGDVERIPRSMIRRNIRSMVIKRGNTTHYYNAVLYADAGGKINGNMK